MATVASEIAVLKEQMATAITTLKSIEAKQESVSTLYLPRTEFNEWKKGQAYQKILIALITAIVVGIIEYGIVHHV